MVAAGGATTADAVIVLGRPIVIAPKMGLIGERVPIYIYVGVVGASVVISAFHARKNSDRLAVLSMRWNELCEGNFVNIVAF